MGSWFTPSDSDNQSGQQYNEEYNRQQQEAAKMRAAMVQPRSAPTPSDVAPLNTQADRRNRISALKYGAMSTIKTSPQGVTGAGPELQTPSAQGKAKIGS